MKGIWIVRTEEDLEKLLKCLRTAIAKPEPHDVISLIYIDYFRCKFMESYGVDTIYHVANENEIKEFVDSIEGKMEEIG